jgi:glutamate dehydrogenase/leucine dehydrogenase
VQVHKLASTNGFIVFDLDGATTSVGVTRLAPKVLQDGAELLARSTTYAFATFGLDHGGASAAINATPETRDEAIAAFVTEVEPMVVERRFLTSPGLGLGAEDLAPLLAADPRPQIDDPALIGGGALACAEAVIGDLTGKRALILGPSAATDALTASLTAAGATLVEGGPETECDVLFAGGKAGAIDHDVAAQVRAGVVVPIAQVPVTAKALAVLGRATTIVMPDFVSLAAPLLAGLDPDGGEPIARVRKVADAIAAEGTGAWMVAAGIAEAHLKTWQEKLPFGRPLA